MKIQKGEASVAITTMMVIVLIIIAVAALMFGLPMWNVWAAKLSGEAALAKANGSRQILITTAKAEEEAAVHRAAAIKIIGESAKQFPEYRQQEFIGAFAEALHNGRISQIIYVPTEAGIPILEAGKRQK